jgi:hypothetical protein
VNAPSLSLSLLLLARAGYGQRDHHELRHAVGRVDLDGHELLDGHGACRRGIAPASSPNVFENMLALID